MYTASNRLVSHIGHWSNSLLETVTNQSCISETLEFPAMNWTCVPLCPIWLHDNSAIQYCHTVMGTHFILFDYHYVSDSTQ